MACFAMQELLEHFEVDDAADASPVHLGGGLWGMLAVGIFADPTMAAEVFTMADANAHRHRLTGAIYVRLFQGHNGLPHLLNAIQVALPSACGSAVYS